jgi:sugar lactone lactonase YvrE
VGTVNGGAAEMRRVEAAARERQNPPMSRAALLLAVFLAAGGDAARAEPELHSASARPPHPQRVLLVSEGQRIRRVDLASVGSSAIRQDVLVERAADGGRDVNGMICRFPDGSGRFVSGEDTGEPDPPAGWGLFAANGVQEGKLVASATAAVPDPYGCAFDPSGRLFTTEIGDAGIGDGNGQLILWFAPFAPGPAHACKIATDLGTATGLAIDGAGRVYVSSASSFKIERFDPPFPTAADAAGGCGRRDRTGAPLADRVVRKTFARAHPLKGLVTYSGLAFAPNGNLYAASVATGRIGELTPDGELVRLILDPGRWLPPYLTGTPQGVAVDADGTVYYADLDLTGGLSPKPGPNGKVWRIRFANGAPLPPEVVLEGLAYPDGVTVGTVRN